MPASHKLGRHAQHSLLFIAVLLAGACAQRSGSPDLPGAVAEVAPRTVEVIVRIPEVSPADQAARDFLDYQERLRLMPRTDLPRELARLDPPVSPARTLELALALGQTRNPPDTARALALLEALLRSADPALAPWQPLARLLAGRYAEQRRLEDQTERQAQQLRDSQRRIDQLTHQLEALKAIERSLSRPPP
jgi:hypothetical protein